MYPEAGDVASIEAHARVTDGELAGRDARPPPADAGARPLADRDVDAISEIKFE
jgi:hypothetical protein